MSNEMVIEQKQSLGNTGAQIGVQNNYGLSVSDATQMAFGIFREHYPQLKEELLQSLHSMVLDELTKQNPSTIVTPNPRIAVPSLQGASITEEDSVRRLYAKLLASDMNGNVSDMVHPAFTKIIDQMSAFDAMLLKKIFEINDSIPVARITFTFGSKYLTSAMPHYFSSYFDSFEDRWKTSIGIENLSRLRLIHFFEGQVTTFDYSQFKSHPFVIDRFEFARANNPNRIFEINVSEYVIQLNDFGKQFIKVCLPT